MFSKKPCILEHEEEVWISKDRRDLITLLSRKWEAHCIRKNIVFDVRWSMPPEWVICCFSDTSKTMFSFDGEDMPWLPPVKQPKI